VNVTAVWDYGSVDGFVGWHGHRQPPRAYQDWRELLDKEDLDVVCTCVHHNDQTEMLLECCRRGINLLPEKPLTYDWAEYEQVRAAVEESGIFLSMLLTMRFEPPYRKLREVVQSGKIGEIAQATSQKSYKQGSRPEWQRDRKTYAGTIPYVGVHALDLIRWTTGLDIVEVMAYHGNIGRPEHRDMENEATILALLSNGASASARVDFCRPAAAPSHGDDRLRIAGSEGVAEARGFDQFLQYITHTEAPVDLTPEPVEAQFVNYIHALRGEAECIVPVADVWAITEICLRARDAAVTGKPQRV
jgi:predicted dehydrogenase